MCRPTAASEVYLQVVVWADAVARAGTFYPIDVTKALESGTKLNSIYGEVRYRASDHQMVRPVPVMIGNKKDGMKGPEDYCRDIQIVPGEQVMPPGNENGCHLQSYET